MYSATYDNWEHSVMSYFVHIAKASLFQAPSLKHDEEYMTILIISQLIFMLNNELEII